MVQALSPDILQCSDEPIRIPGLIQPHGVLLALREHDLSIVQVSASALQLFGFAPEELLGQSLQMLIGEQEQSNLSRDLAAKSLAQINPLHLEVLCQSESKHFDALIHRSGGLLIFEFEVSTESEPLSSLEFFRTSRNAVATVLESNDRQALLDNMAEFVREFSGFERVMVYLFDSEWNGVVQAESKTDTVKGYLGLKFPASDIPVQARELYRQNYLRLLVSTEAVPSQLVPQNNPLTGLPLDLSGAILRSMSPVHVEYLQNMDVSASMSLSLVWNGELKGLLCCHHSSPLRVEYRVRQVCDFLARLVSLKLQDFEEAKRFNKLMQLESIRKDLAHQVSQLADIPAAMTSSRLLLQLADAKGAAVIWNGRTLLLGSTPDANEIGNLLNFVCATTKESIFSSDHLASSFADAKKYQDVASGLLAMRIGLGDSRWILWFRPDQVKEVSWAGKSEPIIDEASMRLRPRKSFEVWKEKYEGTSVSWARAEIQCVEEFRTGIMDLVMAAEEKEHAADLDEQIAELNALNEQLDHTLTELRVARDAALDASSRKSEIVSMVSHDLRAPLTSIRGSLSLLHSGLINKPEDVAALIRISYESTEFLLKLINQLLDLEGLESGKVSIVKAAVELHELVEQSFQLVSANAGSAKISLLNTVSKRTILGDKQRLLQVLVNLVSNAIKFSPADSTIFVSSSSDQAVPCIKVTDQGRGVPDAFKETIFQRFKQVETEDRTHKGGAGLGLAICKNIVEAHGGSIGVDSELGNGSTFWFALPDK